MDTKTFGSRVKVQSQYAQYEQLFEKIKQVIKEKKIIELDFWNINEIDFCISYNKTQLVITINQKKSFQIIDLRNRNYITSIKYINSAGKNIPSMILVFGVNILYKQYQYNILDNNIIIGITEMGYTNNDTTLKWLQHFIDYIQNKR